MITSLWEVVAQATPKTERDALLTIVGLALLTHAMFNRWEPHQLPVVMFLLVIAPSFLSFILLTPLNYSIFALPVALTVFHASLLSSIVVYRVAPWHPLARYPGPVWMKLSMIGQLFLAWYGRRHVYIKHLHEYYNSDVVRIGPNEISIRDASSISSVLGSNGLQKGPSYDGRSFYREHRGLANLVDEEIHTKRRRPWSRGLGMTALKDYEPALSKRVIQFGELLMRERWRSANGSGVVDMAKCVAFFAYDFMGDMAFGGGNEVMRDGDNNGDLKSITASFRVGMIMDSLPWSGHYLPKIRAFDKWFKSIRVGAVSRVTTRMSEGGMIKDLFYYLNNEDGVDSVSPSKESIVREGVLAILAGSDTTSHTISNIFHLLLRHPTAYKRLQEEVDQFYPPGEDALDPTYYPQMSYLEAVINETMRLFPLQPSGSQRTTRQDGITLGSYHIPPHTSIRVNNYAIQRDPRNFSPNPDSFFPDRWLLVEDYNFGTKAKTKTSEPFTHNQSAFFPFSYGPMNCVGKSLAMKEMRTMVSYVMQRFEMSFAERYDPNEWELQMRDWFALQIGSFPVVVKERSKN